MKTRLEIQHEEITINPIFLLSKGAVRPLNTDDWYYEDNTLYDIRYKTIEEIKELSEKEQENYVFNDETELSNQDAYIMWHPQKVFATREEAESFVVIKSHWFGKCRKDIDYQIYCLPAEGSLIGALHSLDKKSETIIA